MSVQLSEYEQRMAEFARVRALILRIVNKRGGLTIADLSKQFLLTYGFLPRIGNRVRELRKLGLVETPKEDDGLIHIYIKSDKEEYM